MLRTSILTAAVFALGTPAFAACPETALDDVFNIWSAVSQPNSAATPAQTAAALDATVKLCPTDPYVLKAAATAYASIQNKDPATAVQRLAKARQLFDQMWANLNGTNPPRQVVLNGQPRVFGFDDLYSVEGQVLNLLFQAETLAGHFADEHKPVMSGEKPRACRQTDASDAQRAYFWIKDHPESPAAAMNLLDRAVLACAEKIDTGQYADILGHRAKSLMVLAQRRLDDPDALDKLKRAKADADRYLKSGRRYSAASFMKEDAAAIDAALLQATLKFGAAPPREKWFEPETLKDPLISTHISLALDAAWADDSKVGNSAGYKTYVALISDLFAKAKAAKDPEAARRALATGAKDHATGKVRGPGNEALAAPPAFLYNWIDKSVTP